MPIEIDEVERRIQQLEIERAALKKETDQASRERLEKLEQELADLRERVGGHEGALAAGEGPHRAHPGAQGRDRAAAHGEGSGPSATATCSGRRSSDTALVPDLEQAPARRRTTRSTTLQADRKMLKEEVDEEDVAEVVREVDRHPRRPA